MSEKRLHELEQEQARFDELIARKRAELEAAAAARAAVIERSISGEDVTLEYVQAGAAVELLQAAVHHLEGQRAAVVREWHAVDAQDKRGAYEAANAAWRDLEHELDALRSKQRRIDSGRLVAGPDEQAELAAEIAALAKRAGFASTTAQRALRKMQAAERKLHAGATAGALA